MKAELKAEDRVKVVGEDANLAGAVGVIVEVDAEAETAVVRMSGFEGVFTFGWADLEVV